MRTDTVINSGGVGDPDGEFPNHVVRSLERKRRMTLALLVISALLGAGVLGSINVRRSGASSTRVKPKDGSVMITIPAGEFMMGSNDGKPDEKPAHKVYLDSYQIGKYEVTVAQYRKFCDATGKKMPKAPKWGWKNDHPIVNVSLDDAQSYCKWAGGRLPTEAEWEKAARGTDGRTFPWGNTWDKKCANGGGGCDLLNSTAPVGSYPAGASPYGCLDMAGNVWEWCGDLYSGNYYKTSPYRNPKGASRAELEQLYEEEARVSGYARAARVYSVTNMRGGCWGDSNEFCRCACRDGEYGLYQHDYEDSVGFRLAR